MRLLLIVLALVACKPDRVDKPAPPPAVFIKRLSPVIGERLAYHVTSELRLVLSDGTNTLAATERTDIAADEVIESVENEVATERRITFRSVVHQPLGAGAPIADSVTGKTYRWSGKPDPAWSDGERALIAAYVRRDTGEPDIVTHVLTNHDFVRGEVVTIPADQPAPFARGLHGEATIKLDAFEGDLARFAITQVVLLDVRGEKVPITLHGGVTMSVGMARVMEIVVEGHITEPRGPVKEAHMTSLQSFAYQR